MAGKPLIFCGDRRLSWDDFEETHFRLRERNDPSVTGLGLRSAFGLNIFLRHVVELRSTPVKTPYTEKRLLICLATLRNKKASNPKDKVFALYRTLQTIGVALPEPDYAKSAVLI